MDVEDENNIDVPIQSAHPVVQTTIATTSAPIQSAPVQIIIPAQDPYLSITIDTPLKYPPSPLTELEPDLDIEEVTNGPLPSVTDDIQTSPGEYQDPHQLVEQQPYTQETDALGYKIRPEERPEHPDFLTVNKAYSANIQGFMDRMKDRIPISQLCDTIEAFLAEHEEKKKVEKGSEEFTMNITKPSLLVQDARVKTLFIQRGQVNSIERGVRGLFKTTLLHTGNLDNNN